MVFINDTTIYTTTVKRRGDSVFIQSEYGAARAKVDAQGHILGYDAPGSTEQVVVTRVRERGPRGLRGGERDEPSSLLLPHRHRARDRRRGER